MTPLQSIRDDLIRQQREGRDIRKVVYIWSVKDKATIDAITGEVEKARLPVSFQPPVGEDPTRLYEEPSDATPRRDVPLPIVAEEAAMPPSDLGDIASDRVFHSEFYLSTLRPEEEFPVANIRPETEQAAYLRYGRRPDIARLFAEVERLCTREGIPRVAVAVCGPHSLVHEVDDLCRRSQLGACGQSIYDRLYDYPGHESNAEKRLGRVTPEVVLPRREGLEGRSLVQFHCHKEVFNF